MIAFPTRGTSGGWIVYNMCTTTAGTIISDLHDPYYQRTHNVDICNLSTNKRKALKRQRIDKKRKRPMILSPCNCWDHNNSSPKMKTQLKKRPYNGCCHL